MYHVNWRFLFHSNSFWIFAKFSIKWHQRNINIMYAEFLRFHFNSFNYSDESYRYKLINSIDFCWLRERVYCTDLIELALVNVVSIARNTYFSLLLLFSESFDDEFRENVFFLGINHRRWLKTINSEEFLNKKEYDSNPLRK